LFTDNLHNILQEIYRLVKHAGFAPDYVEQLNPMERNLYWAYYLQEMQEASKQDGQYTALDENIPRGINMQGLM
jgi:hypothetical protein